jgi:hypothetical protein
MARFTSATSRASAESPGNSMVTVTTCPYGAPKSNRPDSPFA